jgi:HSP20 family protein
MAVYFSDPYNALLRLQNTLDSYRSADWFGTGTASSGAYPPINVFQQDENVVVIAEIPGVRKSDLDIQVKNNRVRISGKRTVEYEEGASLHRRERPSGSFDRTITVPMEIEADQVKAEYRDGVLAVYLPRAERDKPRSVAIG